MKMKTKPSYFNVNQTLTWMTAIGSFASLVGIVIVAAELFKYQESVSNMNTIAGKPHLKLWTYTMKLCCIP